tara:strand:+ start:173 stop:583 length:411 start_codon:yes stop_codon:yes gene_type:complete
VLVAAVAEMDLLLVKMVDLVVVLLEVPKADQVMQVVVVTLLLLIPHKVMLVDLRVEEAEPKDQAVEALEAQVELHLEQIPLELEYLIQLQEVMLLTQLVVLDHLLVVVLDQMELQTEELVVMEVKQQQVVMVDQAL